MPEPAVVNTSPLIFLSKAGLLNFLQLVADAVLVPNTVANEINRRGPGDVTANALANTPWLQVIRSPPVPAIIQNWDLGPGESAVLAYAHSHSGTIAI